MSVTITDPELLAALSRGDVELKRPDGRVLGKFIFEPDGKLPPGVKSPFTEEQLVEFRKQRTGRPLADILKDLRERG